MGRSLFIAGGRSEGSDFDLVSTSQHDELFDQSTACGTVSRPILPLQLQCVVPFPFIHPRLTQQTFTLPTTLLEDTSSKYLHFAEADTSYVDLSTAQSEGLISFDQTGAFIMQADSSNLASGRGRDSVRIGSNDYWNDVCPLFRSIATR